MFAVAFNPENIIIYRYNQALNEVIEVLKFTLFVKRGGRDDINQVQMFKLGSKLCVTGRFDCETICKEIHVVDMKNIKKPEIFKWEKDFLSVRPYTIQELPNFQNHFAITIDPDVETFWLQCKIQILSKEKIAKVKLIRKLDYDGVSINYRTISPWTSDIIPFPDGKSDCRVAYEIDTLDESGRFFLSLKRLSYQPFNHQLKHLELEVRGKSNVNQVQTDTIERKRVEFIMNNIETIELLPGFGSSSGEGRYFLCRTISWEIYLCNFDNFEIISLLMDFNQKLIILKANKSNCNLKYKGKPPNPSLMSTYSTRLKTKGEEERKKQLEEDKEEMEDSDSDCQKVLKPVLDHWSTQVTDNYDIICPFNYSNIQRFRFMLPQPINTDQK
ncbi:hypothetical protein FGO68_gene15606 [Halteria grandinella]|uniref:Uncharacterized protein n=1 Tax=Halteria grandinella TaxID=5974 RepID=A0A8J8NRF0_HALGN|nr:hypothetical protein FGO68_gene15606 [Halteria grandinella]